MVEGKSPPSMDVPAPGDLAQWLESVVIRAVETHAGAEAESLPRVLSDHAIQVLDKIPADERGRLLSSLRDRKPDWFAGTDRGDPKRPIESGETSAAALPPVGERARLATLERKNRDLSITVSELGEKLAAALADHEALGREWEERSRAHRELTKKVAQVEDRLVESSARLKQEQSSRTALEAKLQETQAELRRQSQLTIERDTELKKLQTKIRETVSVAVQAPPPVSAAPETSAEAAAAVTVVPRPTGPDGQVDRAAFAAFCEAMKSIGRLNAGEASEAGEDVEPRLGALAAILVDFQVDVEKVVIAQLDELARRHSFLNEFADTLRFFRKTERTWWWSLTQRRKMFDPIRQYASFISELRKMNHIMMISFYRVIRDVVSAKARELMDPAAIRRLARGSNELAYWEYYETEAAGRIPNQLGDVCYEELAKTIRDLARSGSI